MRAVCDKRKAQGLTAKGTIPTRKRPAGRVERQCGTCGKIFTRKASVVAKGWGMFCTKECGGVHQRATRGSIERRCLFCGDLILVRRYVASRGYGRYCDKDCYGAHKKEKVKGEQNPRWEGGKTLWNHKSDRGRGWANTRRKVRVRDDFTCQRCRKTEAMLGHTFHAHHIVPRWNFASLRKANAMKNLTLLCNSCHGKTEVAVVERQLVFIGRF
jgi:5-methylcytosine-specific restriction endonuclease McrA